MQIVRKETTPLHLTLDITLEPSDYKPKLDSEIKKYKNQAQLKGFRKGKTPDSVIKKMYGKSILADVINETLQDKLFGYLDEEQINYLGQPLANEDENLVLNLDINNPKDYKFSFDLGIAPDLDIKGASETDAYTFYDVSVQESLVDEELSAARRRNGKRIEATDVIQLMDMIKLDAEELDDNVIKEDGWKTDITMLVNVIDDEAVKNELLTKKIGDTISFDVYKLENKDQEYIRKYLLKVPAESEQEIGNMFTATITEVSRIEPAELNEEFYITFGDETVTDEASLRDFLRNDIKKYYDNQAEQFMYREVMDYLMENNTFDLPEDFLKRYLKVSNEKVSEEVLEKEFDAFAKNMKWSLQKSSLAKRFDIKVDDNDIKKHFTNSVFSYMRSYGNMDYGFITQTVDRLMKDKEQVNKAYEEILADKIFVKVGGLVKRNKVSITQEDFAQKVKELNERVNNF
ncbi:MAG: trigger factor [Saprospiraceae bacterium]|jgi:trigger factor|nr:trigger factor [Saprospiraceae bacterium]MBL0024462.1 trigger factor [Saprospiraceae bacterium]